MSRVSDHQTTIVLTTVVSLLVGSAVGWLSHPDGPSAMPSPCERLGNDYWKTVGLLHQVAPVQVQLHSGAFDSTYVQVQEGVPGSPLVANHFAIDQEWIPRFDESVRRQTDDFSDCQSTFPEGILP